MADRPINLRDWQALAAQEGRLKVIVVPMKVMRGTTWDDLEWRPDPDGLGRIGEVPLDKLVAPLTVGDRYWGREQHAIVPRTAYRMSEGVQQTDSPVEPDMAAVYRAGWERSKPGWRSPAAMPRWASRITILPTSIRVCRVQDVTEEEARGAGVAPTLLNFEREDERGVFTEAVEWFEVPDVANTEAPGAVDAFACLWNHQHGDGAWERNPWCAVACVTTHRRNIDSMET